MAGYTKESRSQFENPVAIMTTRRKHPQMKLVLRCFKVFKAWQFITSAVLWDIFYGAFRFVIGLPLKNHNGIFHDKPSSELGVPQFMETPIHGNIMGSQLQAQAATWPTATDDIILSQPHFFLVGMHASRVAGVCVCRFSNLSSKVSNLISCCGFQVVSRDKPDVLVPLLSIETNMPI